MKQKLLNSFKLRVCLLVAVLCASFTGTVWGAENDVHDMNISFSQLLNNNAAIQATSIVEQTYPVKTVTINWRYNKSTADVVTIEVTVGGQSWGTKSVGTNTTDDVVFEGTPTKGAIEITYTNNAGSGTGKGTFYVNSVKLTEGASAPAYTITAQSNNTSYGSVSLSGNVITGSPKSGYRYADPAFTVSPANSATVSQNGNAFTVTPSANTTVTINFEAIPKHTVSITAPTGGTLVVKDGEVVINNGAEVEEGTVLNIEASPDDGYNYTNWQYKLGDGSWNTETVNYSTPAVTDDISIRANFAAKVYHNAVFSVNGTTSTQSVEEGVSISFPSNPANINGKQFVGWADAEIGSPTAEAPEFFTSATMGNSDITYYAVFADATESYSDSETEKTQTLQYDTWTYDGTTTNKSGYRLFHTGSYIESAEFDLSLLKKVIVYGGTFGGDSYNSLSIGDGTNTWKNVTVSGSSQTGKNEYSDAESTPLTGTGRLRITCKSGTESSSGVRISKVEIYTKKKTISYTNYSTTVNKAEPIILVEDASIAYGKTYTIDDELIEGGTITVTSSNPTVASVDGLIITGLAAGTTIITVATAENAAYVEGSETFTLTVTAPEGATAKPIADPVTVFYESFNDCNGTGGNDNQWSGSIATGTPSYDVEGWTNQNDYRANQCIKLGSGSNLGKATTPSLNLEEGITYTLTFRAGAWSGKSTNLKVSMTNGMLSANSVTMKNAAFDNFELTITNASSGARVTFEGNKASDSQFFLDEVKITKPGAAIASTTVTTTGGLATYCYEYPLNLNGISGAKAYKVTTVDTQNNSVKMEQITGTIKGGVPFILKSDADAATIEIPLADASEVVPAGNRLIGTLVPTFVAQINGDYTNFAYSKSNGCFVKLGENGNTVPANRAYLPINLNSATGVKSFALSFDDEDGITSTMDATSGHADIFNLAGQRVNKAQKGIYIINGKKVLVK